MQCLSLVSVFNDVYNVFSPHTLFRTLLMASSSLSSPLSTCWTSDRWTANTQTNIKSYFMLSILQNADSGKTKLLSHMMSYDMVPCSGSRPCRTASLLAISSISSWLVLSFCSSFTASSSILLFSASSCLIDSSVSSIFSLMFQPSCLLRSFKGSSVLPEFSGEHCEALPSSDHWHVWLSTFMKIILSNQVLNSRLKEYYEQLELWRLTLWRLMLVVNSNFICHLCE